jgi:hypothetical protein
MQTFQNDHNDLQKKVANAQQEASDAQVWLTYLQGHREVRANEANRLMVLEYFNGEALSIEGLDEAFGNPNFTARIAFLTSDKDRANSIATIEKITGVGETAVTKWQTNEELAAKANELETRRELFKKSPEELRAIIQAAKPVPVELELPAEMTRKYLLNLPPAELKTILRTYGSPAVNKRLAGQ